jgi:hypothetical protein
MIHLNTYNISFGWEMSQESKCQFDSQPLKVKNRYELHTCKRRATYCWKYLDKGYNFASEFTSIKGFYNKFWASKVIRVPILGILGLLTWESWETWHLGATPMTNQKRIIWRGRWWLPPSLGHGESCKSVYAHGSFVHQKCPTMH